MGQITRLLASHHIKRILSVCEVALAVVVGAVVFGATATATRVAGPVSAAVHLRPATEGRTELAVPPLGRVSAGTHRAPLSVTVSLEDVDVRVVQELVAEGAVSRRQIASWMGDVRSAALLAAARGLAAALAAAAFVAWALTRRRIETLAAVVIVFVVFGAALGAGAATFDERAFREPTFEGALTYAPAALGLVQSRLSEVETLQRQAGALASNLAAYYNLPQSLVPGGSLAGTYRVLHVSDQHLDPVGLELAAKLADAYDVEFTVDTGDLTNFGTTEEANLAAARLGSRPYLFLPGNHDSPKVVEALKALPNVTVLDDESTTTPSGLTVYGLGDPAAKGESVEPDWRGAAREGTRFAGTLSERMDIVGVHNPSAAKPFRGKASVVLSGHTHRPSLDTSGETVLLGSGTTGGVTFGEGRADPHIPHGASVLYFSKKAPHRLIAIDRIEVYGPTGESSIRRTIIDMELTPSQ